MADAPPRPAPTPAAIEAALLRALVERLARIAAQRHHRASGD